MPATASTSPALTPPTARQRRTHSSLIGPNRCCAHDIQACDGLRRYQTSITQALRGNSGYACWWMSTNVRCHHNTSTPPCFKCYVHKHELLARYECYSRHDHHDKCACYLRPESVKLLTQSISLQDINRPLERRISLISRFLSSFASSRRMRRLGWNHSWTISRRGVT